MAIRIRSSTLPDAVKGQIIIIRKRWGGYEILGLTNKKKTDLKKRRKKPRKMVQSVIKRILEKRFGISLLICSCLSLLKTLQGKALNLQSV